VVYQLLRRPAYRATLHDSQHNARTRLLPTTAKVSLKHAHAGPGPTSSVPAALRFVWPENVSHSKDLMCFKFLDAVNLDAIRDSVQRTIPALANTCDGKRGAFRDRRFESNLRASNAGEGGDDHFIRDVPFAQVQREPMRSQTFENHTPLADPSRVRRITRHIRVSCRTGAKECENAKSYYQCENAKSYYQCGKAFQVHGWSS
jgi:hypothetical protein